MKVKYDIIYSFHDINSSKWSTISEMACIIDDLLFLIIKSIKCIPLSDKFNKKNKMSTEKTRYSEDQKVRINIFLNLNVIDPSKILSFINSISKKMFIKKIILEYCLKNADRLYEKFTHDINRKTQSGAWKDIVDQLKENEKIDVENVTKLKQNVSNWIRRATVSTITFGFI